MAASMPVSATPNDHSLTLRGLGPLRGFEAKATWPAMLCFVAVSLGYAWWAGTTAWLEHFLRFGCAYAIVHYTLCLARALLGTSPRQWALVLVYIAAVTACFTALLFVPGFDGWSAWAEHGRATTETWLSLAVAVVLTLPVLVSNERERQRERRRAVLQEERDKVESLSRSIAEANLMALQAQVEPHFLYNTLANVQYLLRRDPGRADTMISQLIVYLRRTLPDLRARSSHVEAELALVEAYLQLMQTRMGTRLRFELSADDGLRDAVVPPAALLTLVENAIKHGIEPAPEGGTVTVHVRVVAGGLELSVADDGAGFRAQAGSGVGLSNLRARLFALYGSSATLSLEANTPRGVVARIAIPHEKKVS